MVESRDDRVKTFIYAGCVHSPFYDVNLQGDDDDCRYLGVGKL